MGVVLAVLMLTGCTNITTTAVWKDPQAGDWRLSSVLVMGVAQDQLGRASTRTRWRRHYVRASASYVLQPDSHKLSPATIDGAIANRNFEAVLVTHVVGTGQETVYYPGRYEYHSQPVYDSFYRYYTFAYDCTYEPGYTLTFTTVSLETSLYQTASRRVAWRMRAKSIDPGGIKKIIRGLLDETARNLTTSGFVP